MNAKGAKKIRRAVRLAKRRPRPVLVPDAIEADLGPPLVLPRDFAERVATGPRVETVTEILAIAHRPDLHLPADRPLYVSTPEVVASKARGERQRQAERNARPDEPSIVVQAARAIAADIDGPTPEREAKGAFELQARMNDRRREHLTIDVQSTAIARLARAGRLDDDQVKAANEYYRSWDRGRTDRGRSAFTVDRVNGGGGELDEEVAVNREAARQSLYKARSVVRATHPDAPCIVDSIVIEGATAAEAAQRACGSQSERNQARSLGLLECALFALAKHYGITRG